MAGEIPRPKISTCRNMSILAACRIPSQIIPVLSGGSWGDIKREVNDKLHHRREKAMVYQSKRLVCHEMALTKMFFFLPPGKKERCLLLNIESTMGTQNHEI